MNLFYEVTFVGAKLAIGGLMLTSLWAMGLLVHERCVRGNVDAFKPERRVGPANRRTTLRVP